VFTKRRARLLQCGKSAASVVVEPQTEKWKVNWSKTLRVGCLKIEVFGLLLSVQQAK